MQAVLIASVVCGTLAFPTAVFAKPPGNAPMLSPAQALGAAIAPRRSALEACGVRFTGGGRKVRVAFKLAFDGSVRNLRVSGLDDKVVARQCLVAQFARIRLPPRLSFIIRDISLPLRVTGLDAASKP